MVPESIHASPRPLPGWSVRLGDGGRVTRIRMARRAPFLCALIEDPGSIPGESQGLLVWSGPGPGPGRSHGFPAIGLRAARAAGVRPTWLHDAAPSPDGTIVAVQVGTQILLVDSALGRVRDRIDVGIDGCRELEFIDGETLASACALTWPPLAVCRPRSGDVRRLEVPDAGEFSTHMVRLAADPDGARVALALHAGQATIWDARSGDLWDLASPGAGPRGDADRIAPPASPAGKQFCRRLRLAPRAGRIAWATYPATEDDFARMGIWLAGDRPDSRPSFHPVRSSMSAAEFSPDLSSFACPIDDVPGHLGIWVVGHPTPLATLAHGLEGVHDICWSSDGRWLAIGGLGGLVLYAVELRHWTGSPHGSLWRLRVGEVRCTEALGHADYRDHFDELGALDARPFAELIAHARRFPRR
jgi:hypothetical protein